ncbi:winged helix-turn-helix transcriptional regulator [Catenuloplanes japonicus]|uniref:winged helix-turn-helix transcriptional regulator n=1 Tax=Catenuloplanes japonicus TaxID=33876 RepID=UPI000A113E0A|nr:helix-turn-helix domain-containing protein [Catenuloplanes japonicus]
MVDSEQVAVAGVGARYEVFHTDCPARDVVDHVTSRWGIWVLISLLTTTRGDGLRFFELRESIHGISEKMLAQTLRGLVADGLVWREVTPATPPQVTYGLTPFGRDLGEPLTDLFDRITRGLPPELKPARTAGSSAASWARGGSVDIKAGGGAGVLGAG